MISYYFKNSIKEELFRKLAASLVEISAKSKVKEALNKFSETPMTVKIRASSANRTTDTN